MQVDETSESKFDRVASPETPSRPVSLGVAGGGDRLPCAFP